LRVRHADIEIEYQVTRMQLGAERLVTSTIAAALLRHIAKLPELLRR
jgi:hypothetical protein